MEEEKREEDNRVKGKMICVCEVYICNTHEHTCLWDSTCTWKIVETIVHHSISDNLAILLQSSLSG